MLYLLRTTDYLLLTTYSYYLLLTTGTLLYEMLLGAPPFYSRNLHTMYGAILHAELRIPR